MKKFKFKLKNVLHYRETLEELAKNQYREAVRLLNIEKDNLSALQERKDNLKALYNIKPGSVVDPQLLSFISTCTSQLVYLIHKQKEVILEKEKIAAEKFNEWNQKRKDVKVIKRLEEKKWKEYLKEVEKEEQKFQDEIFIAKTVREMRNEK